MELSIKISTEVKSFEMIDKIEEAIRIFFPTWMGDKNSYEEEKFPSTRDDFVLVGEIDSVELFFEKLRKQKILDTAFDVMTINLENDKTSFSISRQSALSEKVSFVLEERILGGTIDISISKQGLDKWFEQQTWHDGRNSIPRSFGDELTMKSDGEPQEWFENV